MAMGVVDVVMVGRLGGDPLAAAALGNTWSFLGVIFAMGVAMGIDPEVTQAYGARDPAEAGRATARGAVLMGLVGTGVIAAHLVAEPGLAWLGEPAHLLADAGAYCRVLALSVPAFVAFSLVKQLLQGSGRMRPILWVVVVANGVNLFGNWVLIFGNLGAPALGVVGSAWATLFARLVLAGGLVALGWPTLRRAWPGWAGWQDWLSPAAVFRLAGVALPVGVQTALEGWAFIGSSLMMGWVGADALAAHTVAMTLCSTSFMVPLGVSGAAATRVGNLVGAGEPWRRAGWTAVGLGAAVMAVSATTFVLFPDFLATVFTEEAAVVVLVTGLLPLAAAFQLFDGTQVVAFGVLRGVGDTRLPAVFNLIGYWIIGLPVGYFLAFSAGFGPRGIWVGLSVGLAVAATLLVIRVALVEPRATDRR